MTLLRGQFFHTALCICNSCFQCVIPYNPRTVLEQLKKHHNFEALKGREGPRDSGIMSQSIAMCVEVQPGVPGVPTLAIHCPAWRDGLTLHCSHLDARLSSNQGGGGG